ncbi:MAG: molybdopterin cofactor-binding domain-containing protein [Novosphingobium sp.]
MRLTRRGLLVGALAGGGLAVGYTLLPRRYPIPLPPGEGETAFDAWIRIGRDGVVGVSVPECEMGQGITTLLPQIVAIELGADWRQVAVVPAPVAAAFANPVLAARWADLWTPLAGNLLARRFAEQRAFVATADGASLAAYEGPAREAAASVRGLLAKAAAARWDVGWERCRAQDGFIVHRTQRLRFGELAAAAAAFDPPDPPPLLPEPARERPGPASEGLPPRFPRLDVPAKVDGSLVFAGDVRLPGMVHVAIAHGPIGDAELTGFDKAAAASITGLVGVVEHRRWLAAAAADGWAADRALVAMKPRFRVSRPAESTAIAAALDRALDRDEAMRLAETGGPDAQLAEQTSFSARYEVAPALHATLETTTATARFGEGRLELWLASQAPGEARRHAARALGLGDDAVTLYPTQAGGSFDRRLEHEVAAEVALIARALDRPVQLAYARRQEALRDWPRPPAAAILSARIVPDGGIVAWRTRIAVPATAREFGRRLFDDAAPHAALARAGERDPLAVEGAVPAYAIPHLAVDHVAAAIGLPTSRLRGNAHGYTAFFTECFIDELAHAAGREPLSYRIAMLDSDLRLAACLGAVARLAQWDGGRGWQGLACHAMPDVAGRSVGGGRIAVIATVRGEGPTVRVASLAATVDLGRIVNLDLAREQVEGGLLFGLGMALGGTTRYRRGVPTTSRLAGLDLPLLADCPEIAVEFVASDAPPFDPGEIGVVAVAPAVANALFAATGVRQRRLPVSRT